jgi:hypothetical protein
MFSGLPILEDFKLLVVIPGLIPSCLPLLDHEEKGSFDSIDANDARFQARTHGIAESD